MNIFGHAERKIIPEPKTISINNEKTILNTMMNG